MSAYKTVAQLAKGYKDGKINRTKAKAVVADGKVTVSAIPVDKKTKKAIVGATAEVVFEACAEATLKELLKKSGVPVA